MMSPHEPGGLIGVMLEDLAGDRSISRVNAAHRFEPHLVGYAINGDMCEEKPEAPRDEQHESDHKSNRRTRRAVDLEAARRSKELNRHLMVPAHKQGLFRVGRGDCIPALGACLQHVILLV